MCIKSTCCTPEAYTTLYVNHNSMMLKKITFNKGDSHLFLTDLFSLFIFVLSLFFFFSCVSSSSCSSLSALVQVMLYVDGMNGVIKHNVTIQWLYSLISVKVLLLRLMSIGLFIMHCHYYQLNKVKYLSPLLSPFSSRIRKER